MNQRYDDAQIRNEADEMADELTLHELHEQGSVKADHMSWIGNDCLVRALREACYRVMRAEETVIKQDALISEKLSVIKKHRAVLAGQAETNAKDREHIPGASRKLAGARKELDKIREAFGFGLDADACLVTAAKELTKEVDDLCIQKTEALRGANEWMNMAKARGDEVTEWKGRCADLEETCSNHVATVHAVSVECEEKAGRIEELLTEADAREDPFDLAQWQADAEASSKENGKLRRKIDNLEQLLAPVTEGRDNTIKKLHELRSKHMLVQEAKDKAEEFFFSREDSYLTQIGDLEKSLEGAQAVIKAGGAVLAAYTPSIPF